MSKSVVKFALICLLVLLLPLCSEALSVDASLEIPVAFQGRFRPAEAYSRLWLYNFYHNEKILSAHQKLFHSENGSANDFIWEMHFKGHTPWDSAPLFWINNATLKKQLGLETSENYFSYHQLASLLSSKTNIPDSQLLSNLQQYGQITGSSVTDEDTIKAEISHLESQGISPPEIALIIETQYPIRQRISKADPLWRVLPSKQGHGEWFPLKALNLKVYNPYKHDVELISNFTAYSDEQFAAIRTAYLALERATLHNLQEVRSLRMQLAEELNTSYQSLAGHPYLEAIDKHILYPSKGQLQAELFFYQFPLIALTIAIYALATTMLFLACAYGKNIWKYLGIGFLSAAFCLHTSILLLRCYILNRPPVSNMFETVIYVPWITVIVGYMLWWKYSHLIVLCTSALAALILLVILQITNINSGLENVQAVLDSQYWLIIHVLMIVGSYGAFILSGVFGHIFLAGLFFTKKENPTLKLVAKAILQTMYIGVALLIPGTVLGGVWAAESWGRFWDWDPKESWAFISICIYLIWIHAYTFHHIKNIGLAVGSIAGLLAISFTWYGVNYVLGTGLHSYGFGTGGEIYYYLFLVAEVLFLTLVLKRLNFLENKGINT